MHQQFTSFWLLEMSLIACLIKILLLLLLLLVIWQSPGLPWWRKVNLITVTHRPHHQSIAAGLYCLTTSPGFLPALCEKWSGFFDVHRVLLSYTRDRRLKVSSERLGNEDKAPCPRTLLPGHGSNQGPSSMEVRGLNRSATTIQSWLHAYHSSFNPSIHNHLISHCLSPYNKPGHC